MKTINETFTDEEYTALLEKKEKLNWHDFILKIAKINLKFVAFASD